MLYIIISNDKVKFENNPLVIKVVENINKFKSNETYLIHTFEKAVSINKDADYFSNKIQENVYWFEDTIDLIVKEQFNEVDICPVIPCLSTKAIPEGLFNYSNDILNTFYGNGIFYVTDIKIINYFNSDFTYNNAINYSNVFRLKIKQLGLVTSVYTLHNLEEYTKKLFGDNFWKYILAIYSFIFIRKEEFVAEYQYNDKTYNAWDELFKVEDILNSTHIYGAKTRSIDLNFKKDKKGKFYLQYEYSGSENTTGRIFTVNLEGYQALQNLPKDDRHVLKAENGCVLVEMDYKSFEFAILCCMLRQKVIGDPHQIMIDNLFADKKLDRQIGKDINYSVIYGKTVDAIARDLVEKFPDEDYFEIKDKLNSQDLFKNAQTFASVLRQYNYNKERMLLKNYFNRWIKVEKDWALLNNYIQSTGADFLYFKFNLINDILQAQGGKNKIILQNHDSILFQLEDKTIEETNVFEKILEIMEEPFQDIKVDVEYKAGRNWGEMS